MASCKTIGEGVDTKSANMVVFVDAKSSYTEIIQNIGRVCRKNANTKQLATILLPIRVNVEKYKDCLTGVDRDNVIRSEMSKAGDFNGILNVISALRQEDPYMFELCLNYPNVITDKEIRNNLMKHNLVVAKEVNKVVDDVINNKINDNKIANIVDDNKVIDDKIVDNKVIDNKIVDNKVIDNKIANIVDDNKVIDNKIANIVDYNKDIVISNAKLFIDNELNYDDNTTETINFNNLSNKIKSNIQIITNKIDEKDIIIDNKFLRTKHYVKCENGYKIVNGKFNSFVNKVNRNIKPQFYMSYEIQTLWKFESNINVDKCVFGGYIKAVTTFEDEEKWIKKLDMIKEYINENNKRPSQHDKDKNIKILGYWLGTQNKCYKKNIGIIKNIKIKELWKQFLEEYKKYFDSNVDIWKDRLNMVKKYINENKKLPSTSNKDIIIKKLGRWVSAQNQNYKKQTEIMKNKEIYDIFTQFLKNYEYLFLDNDMTWKNMLEEVKLYINENNKLPSSENKDIIIKKLGRWVSTQNQNYKKQTKIMKNKEIYDIFTQFLKDYEHLFLDNETIWKNTLKEIKLYINENKKLPTITNIDIDIKKLCRWIATQNKNYKKQTDIMKNKEIYDIFTQFLKDYEHLFLDNETIWKNTLKEIKLYINENKKLPTITNIDIDIKKLCRWIATQNKNYKKQTDIMKNKEIYDIFTQFLKDYEHLFLDNETIWKNALKKVKLYINENNKRPSSTDKNIEINFLGQWLCTQSNNYKKQMDIMKRLEIRLLWEEFITEYSHIFNPTTNTEKPKRPSKKKTTITQNEQQIIENNEIINQTHHEKILSKYQEISKKLTIQNSQTTSQMFKENPILWLNYHDARDFSFQGYDNQNEIPINNIITYITKKNNKNLTILDLGCGRNLIKKHFEQYPNLNIIGYDHVSFNDSEQCDISKLPNQNNTVDICIFSQSLMGSNWESYLEEAIRVLRHNGEIIISESVERYDSIKKIINDKNLFIKFDHNVENNRWFYLHVLNDTN